MMRIGNITLALLMIWTNVTIGYAQKYEPTDKWPYLYADFRNGSIKMSDGAVLQALELNVTLDGKLHYIDEKDARVMAADMLRVSSVSFDDARFLNVLGKMMKVLAENANGTVVCESTVNVDDMAKSDIGYGISSATASTQKVSRLTNDASSLVNLPLSTIMSGRESGVSLPVRLRTTCWSGLK